MLIDAIIENGHVRFLQPVLFAHDFLPVKIDVPDAEVIQPSEAQSLSTEFDLQKDQAESAQTHPSEYLAFKALQDAAFGDKYKYTPSKADCELMQDHWTEKYA